MTHSSNNSARTVPTPRMIIDDDTVVSGAPFPLTAAFFDIDGTLLGPDKTVAQRTKRAIVRLKERGVSLGFATGRASFAALELGRELGIEGPSMFFAGSLITDSSGIPLYRAALSQPTLSLLIERAATHHYHLELYTEEELFVARSCKELTLHQQYLPRPAQITPLAPLASSGSIIKAVMMAEVGAEEALVRKLLASIPAIAVSYSYGASHPDTVFANIVDQRATRAAAFYELLKHHGSTPDTVATFGDSESDCDFLRLARYGVAPANAVAAAKDAASFITTAVEDGGVGLAIEKLFG